MLRPLSLGELLDATFTLYRRHFSVLVGIAAICFGPFQVMNIYAEVAGGWSEHLMLLLVGILIASLGSLVGAAAILKIVSAGYLGRSESAGDGIAYAMSRILPLMVAGFAKYILIMLAFMLLIVPGIIVACGYAVVSQVVVLERPSNPLDALGRSWSLTRGHKGTALVLTVVLSLLGAIPGLVAGIIAEVTPLGVAATVVGSLFTVVLAPLVPCGMTLFYYDLRVRKEAFDLEMLDSLIAPGARA